MTPRRVALEDRHCQDCGAIYQAPPTASRRFCAECMALRVARRRKAPPAGSQSVSGPIAKTEPPAAPGPEPPAERRGEKEVR